MLNRFKLWFNKNSSRILIAIIVILMAYLTIKGINSYYKNQNEDETVINATEENQTNNTTNAANSAIDSNSNDIEVNESEDVSTVYDEEDDIDYTGKQYYMDGATEVPTVNKGTEEYKQVMSVMTKIMNLVYEADKSEDEALKEDIYNIFTIELLGLLSTGEELVDVDNILDYIFYIEDLSDYSIGTIYKYDEQGNVVRYGLLLKYQKDDEEPQYGFTIINMDYNNNTFTYDGTLISLDEIDEKDITEIENRGSNTF